MIEQAGVLLGELQKDSEEKCVFVKGVKSCNRRVPWSSSKTKRTTCSMISCSNVIPPSYNSSTSMMWGMFFISSQRSPETRYPVPGPL